MVMQISNDVLFSCLSAAETGEIYCVLDDENQLLYATGDYTLLQALEDVQFDDTQLKGYFSSSIVSKSIPWKIMNVISNSQLYAASDLLVSLIARFTLLLGLLVMVLFVFFAALSLPPAEGIGMLHYGSFRTDRNLQTTPLARVWD